MATVINNPRTEDTGSSIGSILGILLLLLLIFLFLYYGLPFLNRAAPPQVNVPDKIDVNVNQPK